MADFNLKTLYNFRPPLFLCERCTAIFVSVPIPPPKEGQNFSCPVCHVEYVPTKDYSRYSVDSYLKNHGMGIRFENVLKHCIDLAQATTSPPWETDPPPIQMLLESLMHATTFVHFVSYGMSEFFCGALKLLAQRVDVRGIVANADERILDEFRESQREAPRLEVFCYLRGESWEDFPHQKLVVIDGLLAFTGSANLTTNGWRKAARGKEHVESVTKVNEVIQLHNKFFAPAWAARKASQSKIEMTSLPF